MTIHIIAKSIRSDVYHLHIEPSFTIGECKKILINEDIMRPVAITMVFLGKILLDDRTIDNYGISDGAVVIIVIKELPTPTSMTSGVTITVPATHVETPVETHVETPVETPVETHAETHVETPPLAPIGTPPVETPVAPAETPPVGYLTNNDIIIYGLDQEDVTHITQLINMGFDKLYSIMVYHVCDKNLETAIGLLLEE
jgi:hypothetical protein